jgi:hypothetical protein
MAVPICTPSRSSVLQRPRTALDRYRERRALSPFQPQPRRTVYQILQESAERLEAITSRPPLYLNQPVARKPLNQPIARRLLPTFSSRRIGNGLPH